MPMSIDSQIEPPRSFMALYVTPGHRRPNAPQEVVLARYEHCEDMACILTEHAQTMAFKEAFSEMEVLERCHHGLLDSASGFTDREANWTILRLAELLEWSPPEFGNVSDNTTPSAGSPSASGVPRPGQKPDACP